MTSDRAVSIGATPLPGGTLTFVLTDIESSTKLWEIDPESMNPAVERHEELIRETVSRNGGQVVRERGEGDSTFSVFKKASDAASAAVDLQIQLAKETWKGDLPIKVRMGIHTGEASLRAGNYYGQTINRTARLREIAHGGQALLSQATYELMRDDVPRSAVIVPLGPHILRDLSRAELVYQLTHPDLRSDFPPLRSLGALPNNLPVQLTSFIGREDQVGEVKSVIAMNKLVTVTGPGGFGKTRLALQVAAEMLEDFPDGVWFVELASLRDTLLVPDEIAAQLGGRQTPAAGSEFGSGRGVTPEKELIGLIGTKLMLLVLDNCEHLVASVASLVELLLRSCENLHVLATSRERLWVAGEIPFIVPPLALPESASDTSLEDLAHFEAVRLFNERAALAKPGFEMSKDNAQPIVEITRQLEGMPLGIELAAARLRVLTPSQIAQRLNERFRLLTGPPRATESRHQTLRAVVDWSYEYLTEAEALLFGRLAVFQGGFVLEAAEKVCAGEGGEASEILGLLTELNDKSLVQASEDPGTTRYSMLETVRQYAQEKLADSGELASVRNRHLDWYRELVRRAESELVGLRQTEWFDLFEAEHENLRAALQWSVATEDLKSGLRLASTLSTFWGTRGYLTEGRNWLDALLSSSLAVGDLDRERAMALTSAGMLARWQGDYAAARVYLEQSLALARAREEPREVAFALLNLGYVAAPQGDYAAARAYLEECLAIARKLNDDWTIATALSTLGKVAEFQSDYGKARTCLEEGLRISRRLSDSRGVSYSLDTLGSVAAAQGDYDSARAYLEESLEMARESGGPIAVAGTLSTLGRTVGHQGNPISARTYLNESIEVARQVGYRRGLSLSLTSLGVVDFLEGKLETAESNFKESLNVAEELASKPLTASALLGLGIVANERGDADKARQVLSSALQIQTEIANPLGIAECLEALAAVLGAKDPVDGATFFGAAEALREGIGCPLSPVEMDKYRQNVRRLQERIEEDAFREAWARGRNMPVDEALQLTSQ